jgi:2-C-methyl-D-erythritol 4-phosphate cytidylyltransferase
VLVHDAARPLLTHDLTYATLAAVGHEGVSAAIAAAPVTDTIKRVTSTYQVDMDGTAGDETDPPPRALPVVGETLDRAGLWAVQTPQVFRRAILERALDVPDDVLEQATDDAWLVERFGGRVVVVAAPPENLKVTTPLDLALAEILIARRHP